jgi:hypothetical protein
MYLELCGYLRHGEDLERLETFCFKFHDEIVWRLNMSLLVCRQFDDEFVLRVR